MWSGRQIGQLSKAMGDMTMNIEEPENGTTLLTTWYEIFVCAKDGLRGFEAMRSWGSGLLRLNGGFLPGLENGAGITVGTLCLPRKKDIDGVFITGEMNPVELLVRLRHLSLTYVIRRHGDVGPEGLEGLVTARLRTEADALAQSVAEAGLRKSPTPTPSPATIGDADSTVALAGSETITS